MKFVFVREPRGAEYLELLKFCQAHSAHVAFIQQLFSPPSVDRLRPLLDRLSSSLIAIESVSEWPGNRMGTGYRADRYLYPVHDEVIAILADVAHGLFDWVNPFLPDDLHFLRGDEVVLGQVAHEQFAWINLDDGVFDTVPVLLKDLLEEREVDER